MSFSGELTKDFTLKAKANDLTFKAKAKDSKIVLEDISRPTPRTTTLLKTGIQSE